MFRRERWPGPGPAQRLWVMLPGAYMKPTDFLQAGFVQALRERGLAQDVALLDATIPEIADGSALRRLQEFLRGEAPASVAVSLVGISLGAHLALACLARGVRTGQEAEAAARVSSTVLLAPYLGPREVWGEVAAAGLAQWEPAVALADNDIDHQIWRWLQRNDHGHELYLGYGAQDRFAPAHALMAQALPAHRVDVLAGGHVWPVWTQLWNRHLDQVHAR